MKPSILIACPKDSFARLAPRIAPAARFPPVGGYFDKYAQNLTRAAQALGESRNTVRKYL